MSSDRDLPWEACLNARDLGGLPAAGGRIRRGALVRADALGRLNVAGRRALVDHGVRTLIDLRLMDGEADYVARFATEFADGRRPRWLNLPLADKDTERLDKAERTDKAIAYRHILDRRREMVRDIAAAIADAPDGGVLIHCAAGKDRTGIVVALALAVAGVPAETIAADYALSEPRLAHVYDGWVAENQGDEEILAMLAWVRQARPETMTTLLAGLERDFGSVEDFLLACGLEEGHLRRLRQRLVA